MIVATSVELEQFREQLAAVYPEALGAFDIIQECEGHLSDAAKVIAIQQDIEGVDSRSDWFCDVLEEYNEYSSYQVEGGNSMKNNFLDLMPSLINCFTERLCCTTIGAAIIAVPFAIYINQK